MIGDVFKDLVGLLAQAFGFGGILCIDLGDLRRANEFMEILQNKDRFGFMAVSRFSWAAIAIRCRFKKALIASSLRPFSSPTLTFILPVSRCGSIANICSKAICSLSRVVANSARSD